MRISDWSSDVCSSDLSAFLEEFETAYKRASYSLLLGSNPFAPDAKISDQDMAMSYTSAMDQARAHRSEEHTSELQSLMRISYAVFCLKKTNITIFLRLYDNFQLYIDIK